MKKIFIILSIILIVLIFYFTIPQFEEDNKGNSRVCFSEICFVVEVADSIEERSEGLMYREFLEDGEGMLFVFEDEGMHSFWMKNTLISLDIIWINKENEIVDIKTMEPCKKIKCEIYTPENNALYVLEINSGRAEEFGLRIGETVEIRLKD